MTLTLDLQLEQRIQREIYLGTGSDAAEVIHKALDQNSWHVRYAGLANIKVECKSQIIAGYRRGRSGRPTDQVRT